MACPFFEPDEPLEWSEWPGTYRPPLGRPYDGVCLSAAGSPFEPGRQLVVECCNLGYARGKCDRVPDDSADAVRFSLSAAGALLWVIEKDHLPVEHGSIAPAGRTGRGGTLDVQIEAFLLAVRREASE